MLAYDDSIRVEHGDDLEDESVSESSGSVSVTSQVLDHSAHHPGAGGLTRVNSDNHNIMKIILDQTPHLALSTMQILPFTSSRQSGVEMVSR